MNALTKGSVVFYLAAVFAAGLLAGGMAGFSVGQRTAFGPPPRPREMAAHMCGDLRSHLHLSAEQVRQIQPILDETAAEIESVHSATAERIAVIFRKSNERIAQYLTPDQRVLLNEMQRERQRFFHRGPGPGHPRPGPPPDGMPPPPSPAP
ncbi:MAG: hypothetical protein KGS61_12925 [Verrucomicrobia bacterium]|nr:hypothetical protein [Verrucomicrobiota bacterium]